MPLNRHIVSRVSHVYRLAVERASKGNESSQSGINRRDELGNSKAEIKAIKLNQKDMINGTA